MVIVDGIEVPLVRMEKLLASVATDRDFGA
jgi:hypothetical protein